MDEMQAIRWFDKGPDDYVLTDGDKNLIYAAVLDAFEPTWRDGKWWAPLGSITTLGDLRFLKDRLAEMAARPFCFQCDKDLHADNTASEGLCKDCAAKGS